jgi:hypothetical protein
MNKANWSAISMGVGSCLGTLFFTRFFTESASFDWGRAVFIGVFNAVVFWAIARIRSK